MKNGKVFQDSVHGTIEVESLTAQVIDTPEFQRLRHIHQLGAAHFVFPTGTHSRFEHCMGTYYLMSQLLKSIENDATVDRRAILTEGECFSLKLAALCHDIGHGPYSHVWDRFIKSGGPPYSTIKHEQLSCRIFQRILKNNEFLATSLKEIGVDFELVCALISGDHSPELVKKLGAKSYILELLSNSWNGMDVDKWDYIMRDFFYLGWGQGCIALELDRFFRFYRPAQVRLDGEKEASWHLCFRDSETENVLRVFEQRLHLHRKVYSHKTALAIETMMLDIFNELDPVLHLRDITLGAANPDDCNGNLAKYMHINDTNLWAIASGGLPWISDFSSLERKRAQELCRRIETRRLYTMVGTIYATSMTSSQYWFGSQQAANGDLLTASIAVADKYAFKQTKAIPLERLGSPAVILKEIVAYLPENSAVGYANDLRLAQYTYATNSTRSDPIFFVYRSLDDTFAFPYPLSRVVCFVVIWTGIRDDQAPFESRQPPPCLVKAFRKWQREKLSS